MLFEIIVFFSFNMLSSNLPFNKDSALVCVSNGFKNVNGAEILEV